MSNEPKKSGIREVIDELKEDYKKQVGRYRAQEEMEKKAGKMRKHWIRVAQLLMLMVAVLGLFGTIAGGGIVSIQVLVYGILLVFAVSLQKIIRKAAEMRGKKSSYRRVTRNE